MDARLVSLVQTASHQQRSQIGHVRAAAARDIDNTTFRRSRIHRHLYIGRPHHEIVAVADGLKQRHRLQQQITQRHNLKRLQAVRLQRGAHRQGEQQRKFQHHIAAGLQVGRRPHDPNGEPRPCENALGTDDLGRVVKHKQALLLRGGFSVPGAGEAALRASLSATHAKIQSGPRLGRAVRQRIFAFFRSEAAQTPPSGVCRPTEGEPHFFP